MNAGSAVMLEGPVGSGKTSLVECLAASVGRTSSPHLLKIQLGDQMDSKVFLLSTDGDRVYCECSRIVLAVCSTGML